jgi:hypothetical protein
MTRQGFCGTSEGGFPTLTDYARRGVDTMHLIDHFLAYVDPPTPRRYRVVYLNYHKLWDNLDTVLDALALPRSLRPRFPPRSETQRNQQTALMEGNPSHSEETRRMLRDMYADLVDLAYDLPAVMFV